MLAKSAKSPLFQKFGRPIFFCHLPLLGKSPGPRHHFGSGLTRSSAASTADGSESLGRSRQNGIAVHPLDLRIRGASSAAAKIYHNDTLFGPISASFGVIRPLISEDGVLTWRTKRNVRHVSELAATLHAINRPFILGVGMACNTAIVPEIV
jgi:hypothetical protein